jgi:hypothetical protein
MKLGSGQAGGVSLRMVESLVSPEVASRRHKLRSRGRPLPEEEAHSAQTARGADSGPRARLGRNHGEEACANGRGIPVREVEPAVWEFVCSLLKDPDT